MKPPAYPPSEELGRLLGSVADSDAAWASDLALRPFTADDVHSSTRDWAALAAGIDKYLRSGFRPDFLALVLG